MNLRTDIFKSKQIFIKDFKVYKVFLKESLFKTYLGSQKPTFDNIRIPTLYRSLYTVGKYVGKEMLLLFLLSSRKFLNSDSKLIEEVKALSNFA